MKKRALTLLLAALLTLTGCAARQSAPVTETAGVKIVGRMELSYAEQFTVDYCDGGAALVTVGGEERYLLVPDGAAEPEVEGATVLHTPLEHIYLASSGAMDSFLRLGALDSVRFTGTQARDWSLPAVVDALGAGTLLYAGRYRAPDYELLLSEGCSLALENTMILHSPATREQLEALGIPTLVERSSYESHPLGRMEWIKFYALLVGKTAEAEAFFEREAKALDSVLNAEPTGKTAAFFYLNPNGYVNVRRPGDYVAKMVALAGGVYVPAQQDAAENAQSTVNMQLEAFYAGAKDADVLLYNSNIYPMDSLAALVAANELFADFRAVQSGEVWATEQNVFQQTTAVGGMLAELRAILSGEAEDELTYFHRLS